MVKVDRHRANPTMGPDEDSPWEAAAVFNGSIAKGKKKYHFVYRAISTPLVYYAQEIELSTIGHAESKNGTKFGKRKQLVVPEYGWEQFGCEDPRVTYMEGKYYIFYTAISNRPTNADGIKVAVAVTEDFSTISEKHLVTPFNAKAAALFPKKINGKYAVILSVDTDRPPSKISVAYFDKLEDIWDQKKWEQWKEKIDAHKLDLLRNDNDHVEVGAAPVKTDAGWVLIYSYIKNYKNPPATFTIEAVLLDNDDPTKIIGRTKHPLLYPKEEYEVHGNVDNIVFPSGALINKGKLQIHYGAADTVCCLCDVDLKELLSEMTIKVSEVKVDTSGAKRVAFEKFDGNPIIKPLKENDWESKYTLNPAAIRLDGKVHILYRAMSQDDTSMIGYASSTNGFNIDERLDYPAYLPREDFEKKVEGFSGCEDPRLTLMEGKVYMTYTAFDGINKTKVALTSISKEDFIAKNWKWTRPIVISNPTRSNKNTCLFPEKVDGKYVFLHRMGGSIWLDYKKDLVFGDDNWLGGRMIIYPRKGKWDSRKIGMAAPPIKTSAGWLLLYHGLSKEDHMYRLGAILLDKKNPSKVVSRLDYPILEPKESYEFDGLRPGTVFPCGAVEIGKELYIYYGAADEFVAVAKIGTKQLIKALAQD